VTPVSDSQLIYLCHHFKVKVTGAMKQDMIITKYTQLWVVHFQLHCNLVITLLIRALFQL